MCGRYWIDPGENELLAQMAAKLQGDPKVKTSGEIFPGDHVPVLCKSRAGNTRPFSMEWGYHSRDGRRVINARSETAADKAMFQQSMRLRRCLLPMSAYFEWEAQGGEKIRHRIVPEENGLCYLAGLYRFEENHPVCVVLTRAASSQIAYIHPRMPVILSENEQGAWLNGESIDFSRELPLRDSTQA